MSKVYLEHRDAHHIPGAKTEAQIRVAVEEAAKALRDCDVWMVCAGAGMGVDSGLPDFRGTTGLWKDRSLAMSYEDMSDDKWFAEDPAFAWGTNYTQLQMYRKTEPHEGYRILQRWADTLGKPYFVFTSNIDGQFIKAGFPPDKVVACHGDLLHLQCTDRNCRKAAAKEVGKEGLVAGREDDPDVWSADCIPTDLDEKVDMDQLRFRSVEDLEDERFRCPKCRSLARPNVWFCHDRNYVPSRVKLTIRDNFNAWVAACHEEGKRLVVFECGGGLAIPSVRVESEDAVAGAGSGSLLVRLNPGNCRVPAERGVGLPLGAKDGLSRIEAAFKKLVSPKAAARPRGHSRTRR